MRRFAKRALSLTVVLGAGAVAFAIGNGDIKPVSPVTVVTVTAATGSGSGTATLQNTTSGTTYNVLLTADDTCDPLMSFSVPANPITSFGPASSRNVTFTCPPRGGPAMRRCLVHATNNANGAPLADVMGVCLYGATPGTLVPQQTSLDFGTQQADLLIGEIFGQTIWLFQAGDAQKRLRHSIAFVLQEEQKAVKSTQFSVDTRNSATGGQTLINIIEDQAAFDICQLLHAAL